MGFGIFGKILVVDLAEKTSRVLPVTEDEIAATFLGSGFAARYLFDTTAPVLDPLDSSSPLLFIAGLFTGCSLPGTSKVSVCAKSPLTGIWNEATVGGHWGAEFRRTGHDGIIFLNKSDEPTLVHISDAGVEFQPALDIWGKTAYQVEQVLRPRIGSKAKIATIGPAGEKLVAITSVIFDPPISRVAARGGVGAVMGSKNLKAIVVEGDRKNKVPVADPAALKQQLKIDSQLIRAKTEGLRNFGTSGGVTTVESFGELPIQNWKLGAWKEGAQRISGQAMQPKMLDKHYACFGCPVRCGKIYRHEKRGLYGHGPEFETLGMLGANCLVDDAEIIVEANEWCNRYGIDTISTGSCIGFAIEAFEAGIIDEGDTEGVGFRWDGETMLHLTHKIGRAEGIGKTLGMGVKRAAEVFGKGSERFAVHTKGLEYPAHDPRGHVSMALNYATAARGACHLEALTFFLDRGVQLPDLGYLEAPDQHDSRDKPPIVVNLQNYLSVFNPLGICKFLFVGGIGPSKIAHWFHLVTGLDIGMDGVLEVGERIFNLKRLYNCRLGISSKDDVLPPRLGQEAKPDGRSAGVLPDMDFMLKEYYELRGWSADGIPTDAKLAKLGIKPETHPRR